MVPSLIVSSIYLMFFLSGAAALIYQVVWVRSLTLVFGGSHLAVTAVLSIFMAGLAIGGYTIGKCVDTVRKPLRLYGLLELGIAFFAVVFSGLMKIYPSVYSALAQGRDDSPLYLTVIRVLFSVVALIIPTTLMGGTLPALTRFVSGEPLTLRRHLSFLYGVNTLGAVFGVAAAGFFLLRLHSVGTTLLIAIMTNLIVGVASILLQDRAAAVFAVRAAGMARPDAGPAGPSFPERTTHLLPLRLVLWGIGVSGFCALGYEVLWTRILTVVVGASVYGFTIMLIAFLTGIALGSKAYGLLPKIRLHDGTERSILWFGIVQVVIGVTSLLVTVYLRDLPVVSVRLLEYFPGSMGFFGAKVWSNFALAFLYMVVPALFMGIAFPLAGTVHAAYKKAVGSAVGDVLAYNTVGAILGAALSGFALIYLFGIERSLQMLTVVNIGTGLFVLSSLRGSRGLNWAAVGMTAAFLLFLALNQDTLRIWDTKYFAVFRNNQPEAFRTPEMIRDAVENTDVLYYGEGVEAIVSSIRVKGGDQAFLTNGRVEASSQLHGQQCQYVLGHLPMLLHHNPKKVLVVGAGSGMTLGATSAHPSVEAITLVEIEPKVIGVTRTFEAYNHRVLENHKLKIVFNDGRNYLLTTKEKFDVITADPIHPWFRGAGYLYTTEYFKLAAQHLAPGGIICQWLPIYELTTDNLRSIVRTFNEHFAYTMLWLTHYDAEMAGSNSPIVIDEAELERRIAEPAVSGDLKRVMMGSAYDFLSFFVMGPEGMRAFGRGGIVNTDDNLYLEFSAPFSIGRPSVMGENVAALMHHRESIVPFLAPAGDRTAQERRWRAAEKPARITGRALALFLGGKTGDPEFMRLMETLETAYPQYAPGRFLKEVSLAGVSQSPRLLQSAVFLLLQEGGTRTALEISAVLVPVTKERASVMFVDNDARVVYGELYFPSGKEEVIRRFVGDVMTGIRSAYHYAAAVSFSKGYAFPREKPVKRMIKEIITQKIREQRES